MIEARLTGLVVFLVILVTVWAIYRLLRLHITADAYAKISRAASPSYLDTLAMIDRERVANAEAKRRDFFAAHAPRQIAGWFEPVQRPQPKPPVLPQITSCSDRNVLESWRRDPCFDVAVENFPAHERESIQRFIDAQNAYWTDISAWRDEREQQSQVQWPWAWADAVLAAGKAAAVAEANEIRRILYDHVGAAERADSPQPTTKETTAMVTES